MLYLTNLRIILINSNNINDKFKGFSIKNYKVYSEKFEQPTMGGNYFHGFIKTYNAIFPTDLEFKIRFKGGD